MVGISIKVLEVCDDSIIEPLIILLVNSANQVAFPSRWKKANAIPVYKKTKSIL